MAISDWPLAERPRERLLAQGAGRLDDLLDLGADQAVALVPDGASILVGGFGLCGIPEHLITALGARGTRNLTIITIAGALVVSAALGAVALTGYAPAPVVKFAKAKVSQMRGFRQTEILILNGAIATLTT